MGCRILVKLSHSKERQNGKIKVIKKTSFDKLRINCGASLVNVRDRGGKIAQIHNRRYTLYMKENLIKMLSLGMKKAEEKISELTSSQRKSLEKSWDIEHAYYSSALEGSKVDRKEFEKLGKKIA